MHFLEIRRSSRRRVSESVDIVLHNIRTLGENAGSAPLSSFMLSLLPSSALNTWTEARCIALSKLSHLLINDYRISCWYRIKTVSSADDVLLSHNVSAAVSRGQGGYRLYSTVLVFLLFFLFSFYRQWFVTGFVQFLPILDPKTDENPV